MAARYGFFRIRFVKKDNTPDAETAKRAFAWANENIEWVEELKPFALNGNEWTVDEDEWIEGVDIKNTGVPETFDWLMDVAKATGAEKIVGWENRDFSESAHSDNWIVTGVCEDGKMTYLPRTQYNTYPDPMVNEDDELISDETYRALQPAFKNKKTGEVVLSGVLQTGENYFDDNDDLYLDLENELRYRCTLEGEILGIYDPDGDDDESPSGTFDIVSLFIERAKERGKDWSADDWEFVGIETQPSTLDVALGAKGYEDV